MTAISATLPQIIHIAQPNRPHFSITSIRSGLGGANRRREFSIAPQSAALA